MIRKIKLGDTFGNWIVTNPYIKKNSVGAWFSEVRDEKCGQTFIIQNNNLLSGKSTKCQECSHLASRLQIKIGDVFGSWKITKLNTKKKNNGSLCSSAECIKCGKFYDLRHSDLVAGLSKQCKQCALKYMSANNISEFPIHVEYKYFLKKTRSKCKKRNFPTKYSVSENFTVIIFEKLIFANCNACGKSPHLLPHAKGFADHIRCNTIDRIDPAYNYSENNTQTLCLQCNKMKMDNTQEEFKNHIKRLIDNAKLFIQ